MIMHSRAKDWHGYGKAAMEIHDLVKFFDFTRIFCTSCDLNSHFFLLTRNSKSRIYNKD